MTKAEIFTLIIASLGFMLAAITFYRQFLWMKKDFKLVALNSIVSGNFDSDLEFALVNNGTEEILLLSASVVFGTEGKKDRMTPAARIQTDGETRLIRPRTGAFFKYEFTTTFSSEFAKTGTAVHDESKGIKLYTKNLYIQFSWTEMSGQVHQNEIVLSRWVFTSDGKPMQKKLPYGSYNLYKEGKIKV